MDTARGGAGRMVEHANRQSCCIQLDSGRSLHQIIRDFSRPPTLFSFDGEGMETLQGCRNYSRITEGID